MRARGNVFIVILSLFQFCGTLSFVSSCFCRHVVQHLRIVGEEGRQPEFGAHNTIARISNLFRSN